MRKWLKNIREEKGLTHENVANMSSVTRAFYTQIESGIRNPSVDTAKKIAKALNFEWTIFFNNDSNDLTLKDTG